MVNMLSFHNVSFMYPGQSIFNDISFSLNAGEFCFLVGKSGAGKSTLMQMIYMNLKPASGYLEVKEYNSRTIRKKEIPLLRRKLGIIFQDFKLFNDRTVYENLAFVLKATSTPKTDIYRKISTALSEVGLSHRMKAYPSQLSGGEQQRIAIARLFLKDPPIIFLDEPTANLDAIAAEQIKNSLDAIKKDRTVIIVSHSLSQIIDASHIVVLEKGRAVEDGTHDVLYDLHGTYYSIFNAMANSLNLKKINQSLEE